MKKWQGLDKELEIVEQQLNDVGEILSRPFHKRIGDLLIRLSKFDGVLIEGLSFGMGGWNLKGTMPCREEVEIGEGEKEFDILISDVTCCSIWDFDRCGWIDGIEKVNPGITKVLKELHEVCSTLVDTMYLQYPDFEGDNLKELLSPFEC